MRIFSTPQDRWPQDFRHALLHERDRQGCEVWAPRHCVKRSRETLLPRTVTFPAAGVVTRWCVACALMANAWATPLERVEFEGASQRLISGGLILGDHVQGHLAKSEGAGAFSTVIGAG
jgi:hypothetical protein